MSSQGPYRPAGDDSGPSPDPPRRSPDEGQSGPPPRTTQCEAPDPDLDDDDCTEAPPEAHTTLRHDVSEIRKQLRSTGVSRDRHLLIWQTGSTVGRVVPLGPSSITIGRDNRADIPTPEPGVSRQHARVAPVGAGYFLGDLGSANGSYVNGERVHEKALTDGDVIQLGPTAVLRYVVTDRAHERVLCGLYEASVRDPLTLAFNREHFQQRLEAELAFARRHDSEISVVMYDLDRFKAINDTYGHPMGDRVLVEATAAVRSCIRTEDVLVRYGGEEFVVLARAIGVGSAAVLAERLRARIEQLAIPYGKNVVRATASFGCASRACCGALGDGALVDVADRRLLRAKRTGRNRVVARG